jgi:hypothetical protein
MIEPIDLSPYNQADEEARQRRVREVNQTINQTLIPGPTMEIGSLDPEPVNPRRVPAEQFEYNRYQGVGVRMPAYPFRQQRMQERSSPIERIIYADMNEMAQRVIDGDSFMFDGREYRIANIAAPEWDTTGGAGATAALRDALNSPYNIHVVGTDKYGRQLATLSRAGSDIGEQLIEGGQVEAWQEDWRPPEEKGMGRKLAELPWNLVKGIARAMYFWESDISTKERFYRLANVGLLAVPLGGPLAWAAKGMTGLSRALTIAAGEALIAGGIEATLGENDSVVPHMMMGAVIGGVIGRLTGRGVSKVGKRASRDFIDPIKMASKDQNPLVSGKRWSILSAHKDVLDDVTNAARTSDLYNDLVNQGYDVIPVTGSRSQEALAKAARRDHRPSGADYGSYANEDAFLVPNMKSKDAWEVALRWEQDSMITSDGLVDFRRGSTRPIKPDELLLGQEVDDLTDYFSTIMLSDGKQMHFSLNFGRETFIDGKALTSVNIASRVGKQLDSYNAKDVAEQGLLRKFGARTLGQLMTQWYIKNVRAIAGIERIERRILEPTEDLWERSSVWMQQQKSAPSAISHAYITRGIPDHLFGRETVVDGLVPILEKHNITAETVGDFDNYLVAKRIQAMDQDVIMPKTPFGQINRPELDVWVAAQPAEWAQAADEVYDWYHQARKVLLGPDGGEVLSTDLINLMRESGDNYVPFHTFHTLQEAMRGIQLGPDGIRVQTLAQPLKKMGELDVPQIHSPLGAMMKETYSWASIAYKQQATNKFMSMVGRLKPWEQARYVRKVSKLPEEMSAELETVGKELAKVDDAISAEILDNLIVPHMEQASGLISRIDPDTGKRVWFEIADSGILEAFKFMQPTKLSNELVELFSKPSKWLRAGTTLSLEFLGRNVVRDVAFSTVVGGQNMFNFLRGATSLISDAIGRPVDDFAALYESSGAARSAMVSPDIPAIRQELSEMLKQGIQIKNVVKSPLRALQLVSEFGEGVTRVGNFKRNYQKFIDSGMSQEHSMFNAALLAKTSSVDFAMHGSGATVLPAIRIMTAFWNPMLQGMDTFARALRDRPLQVGRNAFLGITVPSMLLYAHNRKDPEFRSLPEWERAMFWHAKLGDEWIRIPKPFEPGMIFGTQVEKFLEFIDAEDPSVIDDFYTGYMKDLTMEGLPIPTVARPFVEFAANRNFFRGAPIVSKSQEDIDPRFRESPGTSDISKALVRYLHLDKVGIDPLKLDHLMVTWTGAIGRDVVNMGDWIVQGMRILPERGEDPDKGVHAIPLARGFVSRFPSNSQDFDDFYQLTDRVRSTTRTYNELIERFQNEDAIQFATDHAALMGLSSSNNRWVREMAELRQQRQDIINHPTMDGAKKRDLIKTLERQMMFFAQRINNQIAKLEDVDLERRQATRRR